MRVRAARDQVELAVEQPSGERVRIGPDLRLVGAERIRCRDLEAGRLGGDRVLERASLHAREHRSVERRGVLLLAQHEAAAGPGERLVRRGGDEVAVGRRVRVQARGDEAGEMGHVAEEQGADLVGDGPEALGLDHPGIRRGAADDELRAVLLREAEHLVEVDEAGLAVDAVGGDRVEVAREVHLVPVRQVAAVVEPQGQDRVAGLEAGEVDGHVRLRAGVGLHVRVLGSEDRLRALDREPLDLVDHLAAAVVPLARDSPRRTCSSARTRPPRAPTAR